jgi:hypothetical protein
MCDVCAFDPFVVFDIIYGHDRLVFDDLLWRVKGKFVTPRFLHRGGAFSIEAMRDAIKASGHGAIDPVEGAVWRVERNGKVDFLAEWVRPDKVDGCYLPEMSGKDPIWNWRPKIGREKKYA